MKAKYAMLLAVASAGLALTGCGGGPTYVSARIGPPPPPRLAVIGVAPGPGYMWTDGFWDLRGGRWYWMDGRWMRPPRGRAVWVPPHWVERHGRYYFQRGHWRY